MKKNENIAEAIRQNLIAAQCSDTSKINDIEEIKKLRTAARQNLKNQKLSKKETQKILQDLNTYHDAIFFCKTLEIYFRAADAFENFCNEKLRTKQFEIEECP